MTIFAHHRNILSGLLLLGLGAGMLGSAEFVHAADRTVIGELFSADNCLYCPAAIAGLDDLEDFYSTTQFVPVTMYFSTPFAVPGGLERAASYGFLGTPSLSFDGTIDHVGGQSGGSMFATFLPYVAHRLTISSPLFIDAAYVAEGRDITLTVTIEVDEALTDGNQVHFLICQDGLHGQSNLLVDVLESEPLTLTTPGQSTTITRGFTLAEPHNLDDLRIIALVQDPVTDAIHQAALAISEGGNPISPVEEAPSMRNSLGRAYPNPFNPSTTISFTLAESGPTRLDIFTVDGRLVRTLVAEALAAGPHQRLWNGRDERGRAVASGPYFFRFQAPGAEPRAGRMVLVK